MVRTGDRLLNGSAATPPSCRSRAASTEERFEVSAQHPFADGLEAAADVGARAAIQPGGSIRDEEVIEAADAQDVAMVFTGQRHFRH